MAVSSNAKLAIHDLHSKYKNELNLDKTVVAQSAIEKVTSAMKFNISKMMENRAEFDDLEGKSSSIRDTA